MDRKCDHCGKSYQAKTARSKYCSTSCRARAAESKKVKPVALDPRADFDVPARVLPVEIFQSTYTALMAELVEAGVANTSEGQTALALARMIDDPMTLPAARVSAAKQLIPAKDAAMNTGKRQSQLDEVNARRDAKLRALGLGTS